MVSYKKIANRLLTLATKQCHKHQVEGLINQLRHQGNKTFQNRLQENQRHKRQLRQTNMIIEDDMKNFLSQNREVDMLKDSLEDFKHILQQYIDTNNALLYRAFEADGI